MLGHNDATELLLHAGNRKAKGKCVKVHGYEQNLQQV
jgi:hypothetical protein